MQEDGLHLPVAKEHLLLFIIVCKIAAGRHRCVFVCQPVLFCQNNKQSTQEGAVRDNSNAALWLLTVNN